MKYLVFCAMAVCCLVPEGWAQRPAKKTQSKRVDAWTPQKQLAGFEVPEGFEVELVASEVDGLINPIDLAFDPAGRLWTQTARMYPLDPVTKVSWGQLRKLMEDPEAWEEYPEFKKILDLYQGKTAGQDKVLVLSNLYGSDKVKVSEFADGLAIPQSVLPYKDGVFVAQGSELIHLADTDKDGKADERTRILTGFGFTDTHTMAHTMVRGPGGWVHFSQGALNKGEVTAVRSGAKVRFDYSKIGRFSLDGNQVEVIGSGLNNIWGFWMRSDGQWWGTEANDRGWSVTPMEPGTGFEGIGGARLRPYQPLMPVLHEFRVGGTGISGLAFNDDESGGFPSEWDDVAFLANPITSAISAVRVVRNEDGSVSAEHLPDFLTSKDDWFRPVNIEFGPDGCLYVLDWYNKIVSHNEVPRDDPGRDKRHGRLWRIRYEEAESRPVPNLYEATPRELLTHLAAPSAWEKREAVHEIADRGLTELSEPLAKLAGNEDQSELVRIHALWALESIGHFEARLMDELLASSKAHLRREAVRSLIRLAPDLATLNALLERVLDDGNAMVRSQVLRTIEERGEADLKTVDLLVRACKPELPGNQMGGAYERKFERFLARRALEQFPAQLKAYLGRDEGSRWPSSHLLWASQALPKGERIEVFLSLWGDQAQDGPVDESTFVMMAEMLDSPEVFKVVGSTLQDPNFGPAYVGMAMENQSKVQSPELAKIFVPVVERMLRDEEKAMMAVQAVSSLMVPVDSKLLVKLLDDSSSDEQMIAVLGALAVNPKANQGILAKVAGDSSLPLAARFEALVNLAKVAPQGAQRELERMLPTMDTEAKRELVKVLSGVRQAAPLVVAAKSAGDLPIEAFDLASAERLVQANGKDAGAKRILKEVRTIESAKKAKFKARLEHLMAVTDQLEGNPARGKTFFSTCLLCHEVGDEGFDIAPSLDGSAHRDREALLTAILDPDAAMESGYQVFRVIKKDGTTLEGYRAADDDRGVTLAFMGGAKVFVPAGDIASKRFISGRSFMPTGLLDAYRDQDVADLLAYIQTLK
ncbi:MAG: DUF7133 domain-containing protein [Verrucomicrobiales bacterium]